VALSASSTLSVDAHRPTIMGMGEYVELAGLRTWYDSAGEDGVPLVLLHGGLCTNDTWGAQLPAFAERHRVLAPERRGHGHTPDVDGPMRYADMAADTIGFLETVVREPAHLVGWSDGGIIGLLVASARNDLVRKLVTIGANFDVAGVVANSDVMMGGDPDAPALEALRGPYQATSPDGADHWPVVFAKFIEMATTEPHISHDELAGIRASTLVVSGDDDMVRLEHTIELYRAIPDSQLAILPGTSHALMFEKPELLNSTVLDFLNSEPIPTLLPIRRAAR
jgi:pimeloyl-ACP methyl ester carboxylesterase